MKYLLTIYDDESMWSDAQPGEVNQMMDGYRKFGEEVHGNGRVRGRRGAGVDLHRDDRAGARTASASSPTARSRRPRSSSAASTCSTARTSTRRSPTRRRSRSAEGMRRGAAGQRRVFADARRPADAASRPPVPARVGAGGRVADPRPRGLRSRRGGGPGGLDRGARALAARRRAAQPGRVDHRRPRATARSTACAASARCEEKRAQLAALEALGGEADEPDGFPDDRLRLIFTCCHPALVAGGAGRAHAAHARRALGAGGRARVPGRRADDGEAAGARQAQDRRDAGSPTACREERELPHRMPSVLAAVYLIFNEGYAATAGEALVRRELCAEAIRLGRLLVELMPGGRSRAACWR